jgi:hypothetical protein
MNSLTLDGLCERGATTLGIMTLSITTLRITSLFATFGYTRNIRVVSLC